MSEKNLMEHLHVLGATSASGRVFCASSERALRALQIVLSRSNVTLVFEWGRRKRKLKGGKWIFSAEDLFFLLCRDEACVCVMCAVLIDTMSDVKSIRLNRCCSEIRFKVCVFIFNFDARVCWPSGTHKFKHTYVGYAHHRTKGVAGGDLQL